MSTEEQVLMQGFTIIETMIALVIGSIFGITVLSGLGSQVEETNFTTGSHYFVQQLEEAMTDSANGYYNDYSPFNCNGGDTSPVTLTATNIPQGQNYGCIFLGSVVQFSPSTNTNELTIYPVIGNEYYGLNTAETIAEAYPEPIAPFTLGHTPYNTGINLTTNVTLENNLTVDHIYYQPIGQTTWSSTQHTGAIGFLDGDSSGNLADIEDGDINPGRLPLSLYYVNQTNLGETTRAMAAQINKTYLIPANAVQICLNGNDGRSFLATITGTNSSDITTQVFYSTGCQ